jgi:hypothetical protein
MEDGGLSCRRNVINTGTPGLFPQRAVFSKLPGCGGSPALDSSLVNWSS